ncbi:DMT family transporter [Roseovarius sp. LXJ103]|uniref:DMT family transporter n=1 Tax=Roseovarius carneus TaxID=2853164 RepID=UPI000D60ED64|nr:DMT family transporter [Roseovarius carneus]MBZ8118289.1 DMT family transporter [Roseovarius carneus]PWE35989.1 hypothetical protein DD563_08490 [Pelagicola sp. LXJ1103]
MRAPTGTSLTPVLLTFMSAILWGLWWIPIRYLEGLGQTGAQAGILTSAGATLTLVIYILIMRVRPQISAKMFIGAALIGLAFSAYSVALTLSDVVRVILLFYLAPAWSKIIEWAFFGQPWRHSATLTLGASLLGAFFVLGGDLSLSTVGLGDLIAIMSGVAWSVGAALVFSGGKAEAASITLVTAGSGMVWAILFGWSFGEALPLLAIDPKTVQSLALGLIYLTPVLFITMWSAQRLPPGLITFLFTLEIVAGVSSGAWLLDEPFGVMQIMGCTLIVGAAVVEAVTALRPAPKHAPSA